MTAAPAVTKVGTDPDSDGHPPLRPAQRPERLRAGAEDNLRSVGTDRLDAATPTARDGVGSRSTDVARDGVGSHSGDVATG
ncbi:hypothetical protein ACFV6F_11530 [Kitasatospora phosalacinea]|uniref:hypothetical protein n=1 Tax=Kitasatospora phosalacinea TaxID=2065 RepID=UPI00365BC3C3